MKPCFGAELCHEFTVTKMLLSSGLSTSLPSQVRLQRDCSFLAGSAYLRGSTCISSADASADARVVDELTSDGFLDWALDVLVGLTGD